MDGCNGEKNQEKGAESQIADDEVTKQQTKQTKGKGKKSVPGTKPSPEK